MERIANQEEHLRCVNLERQLYRDMVNDSKLVVGEDRLQPNIPCSKDYAMHYSFDFAQQVHIPSNPEQPGPIYFLCPRKVGLFGIACEGVPSQVNYIIDEGMSGGKGANSVLSYLNDFLKNFGMGEATLHLHCDNCSGQNKNKFMIWYLCWRVIHGLHIDISLNFLITGHTKFAPDWGFGLIKQRYRRTMCNCLQDVATVVADSTTSGMNIPRIIGSESQQHIPGQPPFLAYNWSTFLAPYFKPLVGIKSMQHMRCVLCIVPQKNV